ESFTVRRSPKTNHSKSAARPESQSGIPFRGATASSISFLIEVFLFMPFLLMPLDSRSYMDPSLRSGFQTEKISERKRLFQFNDFAHRWLARETTAHDCNRLALLDGG